MDLYARIVVRSECKTGRDEEWRNPQIKFWSMALVSELAITRAVNIAVKVATKARCVALGGGVWDDLPLLTSRDGPLEALAGSNLSGRFAANGKVPDGVYKFVVDKDGKAWLQQASDGLPHSALVPKGEQVHGAGYIAIKNGRANISGRSEHYMKDSGFEAGELWSRYDAAIQRTFGDWFDIVEHNMGGSGNNRPPGS